MKSVSEFHREALDQALRQALGTLQPALRSQALARASAHLIHPRLVLESPLLADSHPWRREALAVADAFEAVTNGMEEPGVLDALDDLAADSPFQPWRHFIVALHFFYEGLDEAVAAHLSSIPDSSPLTALSRTLLALVHGKPVPPALRRLADLVVEADPRILPWVQDVAEGLETDNEPLFWNALADWLEAVAPAAPERARSAVLWAWNQLEWRAFDEQTLLELAESLWSRAESYRLAALGTLSWDPEGAALLWLRFLVSSVRDGAAEPVAREALGLLERFQLAAREQGDPGADWTDTWDNLARAWNAEADARGWSGLRLETAPAEAEPAVRQGAGAQLDLFAS